jgi:hypothetical protein
MNAKAMTQALTIDLTKYTIHAVHVGPKLRGPKRCIRCSQPFKTGEIWQRMKSLPDPEFGSYFIGVHSQCPTRSA